MSTAESSTTFTACSLETRHLQSRIYRNAADLYPLAHRLGQWPRLGVRWDGRSDFGPRCSPVVKEFAIWARTEVESRSHVRQHRRPLPAAVACRQVRATQYPAAQRRNRSCACHRLEPRSLSKRPVRVELRGVASALCQRAASRTSSVHQSAASRWSSAQTPKRKAFVAPGCDLITFLLVCGDAANVRHKYTGFPRDIGADVP
jgi:hypothetical protein